MAEQLTSSLITKEKSDWLKSKIRDIPDFPKPGIVFKDLTTLLKDAEAFAYTMEVLTEHYRKLKPDYIAGIEARGFILGPIIANKLAVGFIPIRKAGKLPHKVVKETYDLEYGTDSVEVHEDAVHMGARVVLVDDLLATGGTAVAAHKLLTKVGAEVISVGFVIELGFLNGRTRLPVGVEVLSLLEY
ncbi:MAG: adenine phosphoribosyltransferase [Candidatus Obscuribacterales bacterium]|nr:adenine phosphoribosyltransferase [Candidatus Obscuribacterales bacterium]